MDLDEIAKASRLFQAEYGGGKNFMTPTVLERGMVSADGAYEISTGTGMDGEQIWGVTIVRKTGPQATTRMRNISQLVWSLANARHLVSSLRLFLREHGWPTVEFDPFATPA